MTRLVLAFVFANVVAWNGRFTGLDSTVTGPVMVLTLFLLVAVLCDMVSRRFLDRYDTSTLRRVGLSILVWLVFITVFTAITFGGLLLSLRFENDAAYLIEHLFQYALTKAMFLSLAYFFANLFAFDFVKLRES